MQADLLAKISLVGASTLNLHNETDDAADGDGNDDANRESDFLRAVPG